MSRNRRFKKMLRNLGIPYKLYKGYRQHHGEGQGGVWWSGKEMFIPAEHYVCKEDYCHEVAHWVVAARRDLPNYGLDDLAGDARLPDPGNHAEEITACHLSFYLMRHVRLPMDQIIDEALYVNLLSPGIEHNRVDTEKLIELGSKLYKKYIGIGEVKI